MTDKLAAEALSQYLDSLGAGHDDLDAYLAICEPNRRELHMLLGFARRVHSLLVPVTPSEVFVSNLRARLMATTVVAPAASAEVSRVPVLDSLLAPRPVASVFTRERVLVGAAAVGSVAAVLLVLTRGRVLGSRAA